MSQLSSRSTDIELMDDLSCEGEIIDKTLRELDVINHWLGGNQVTINGLSSLLSDIDKKRPLTIADIGCGSGDMVARISRWGERTSRSVEVVGIDANPNIVNYARTHSRNQRISFETLNILDDEFSRRKFDIVVATLFMHHFTNTQLVQIFGSLGRQTTIGFVVNDIHRHPLALHSIKLLTSLFSRSSMVIHDAPLSVRRAFTRADLESILSQAGITTYTLKWRWAFRWQLIVKSAAT